MAQAKHKKLTPISFQPEMADCILNGTKIQTRRIIKQLPEIYEDEDHTTLKWQRSKNSKHAVYVNLSSMNPDKWKPLIEACPYGKVGWELYGREHVTFVGDIPTFKTDIPMEQWPEYKWTPSIFMAKRYARIFLRILDVSVERVQDITNEDAYMEGMPKTSDHLETFKKYGLEKTFMLNEGDPDYAKKTFRLYWDKVNYHNPTTTLDAYQWISNPVVWKITFEKL